MAYKQKTWWQSNIAWLKGWMEWKKTSIIGLIFLGGIVIYSISVMGYPLFVANLNPAKVHARITYIYHTHAGKSRIPYRYYKYEYKYDGQIYYGCTKSQLDEIFGDIGDTLIIRCNKDIPKYSAFWFPDNPNLKIKKLTPKERRKLYDKEPSNYDKQ
jgi:hypothetical protein